MFDNLFTQAALGWWGRRALDWGGWLGTFLLGILAFYNELSPSQQGVISQVFTGNWQEITLGSLLPFILLVWSQVKSFKATVRPQIVTEEGVKVETKKDLPRNKKVLVDEIANVAAEKKAAEKAKKPTIFDKLFGRS